METCDQCGPGTVAKFTVALPSGGILTFCGSHTTVHIDKLMELGAFLYRIGEP